MHNHYIKTYKSSLIHFGHHCFARPQSWKSWSSGSRGLWDQSMNAMMTGMTKGTHMLSFDHDAHTHMCIYIYTLYILSLYIWCSVGHPPSPPHQWVWVDSIVWFFWSPPPCGLWWWYGSSGPPPCGLWWWYGSSGPPPLWPVVVVCWYVGMLVCMYVCVCVCMYVMYVCMYVCNVCMYVCNVCMYVCMYVCVCLYMYVCTYVCMYVCMECKVR